MALNDFTSLDAIYNYRFERRFAMRKLLAYMKGYRKECVISPLFKMLEAVFELLVPLVIANIIDYGIPNGGNKPYILRMTLILVVFAIVGLSCTLIAQYFAAKAAVGFSCKVKHSLFSHIQSLSYSEIDTLGTSTLITRMTSDMNQVQTGVNLTLRLFMRSPVVVFGAMIMAFVVDDTTASFIERPSTMFVLAIPLLSIIVFGIMCASIPLYKRVQASLDKVLGRTRENLSGVRVIRAFGKENHEKGEFESETASLFNAQSFVGKISAFMNPATYLVINFAIILLIWTGAIQVKLGSLSQGQVIALYNYMSQILVELIKLANLIINITKAVACGNRVQAVFEIKPSITHGNDDFSSVDTDDAVVFSGVSMRYNGASENSLDNISFSAKKGETIGIVGATGSGKTSLINLITRFYDACEGEILIDGVSVKDYSSESLLSKIGIVPQRAVLFKGSIRDNMKWGNENATDEEIIEAISIAQGNDILLSKNGGLDAYIEQGGKNLSGGQRQRLTIARALVKKPEILILDDSSSALDYATDASLRASIKNLEFKPTVFIVSQRASSVMNADKIIVLEDGEMASIGTHNELLGSCPVYTEIYTSQFGKEALV